MQLRDRFPGVQAPTSITLPHIARSPEPRPFHFVLGLDLGLLRSLLGGTVVRVISYHEILLKQAGVGGWGFVPNPAAGSVSGGSIPETNSGEAL